ncbi:hypothetical protein, variant [Verruconis gallopava]|uniref:Protein kinase domain-containing protein n=1 Tax=Verruconis gallopava TaxID=253628 RepID=A0A0D1Y0V5_9PEZI|nr:hypothetical protein, variant [Verruconis gallopava]KIW08716.1 hypothetical protein, variant [Verruconis gallopava]
MQPYSTWRVPTTSYRNSPPRAQHHPFLTHHSSMLELHDQGWARADSPSTRSSSSSGYEGVITPTASSSEVSTPERVATPKPPPSPPIEFRTQLFGSYSRNPFFKSSQSRSPPDSSSRCPTPVAPTPVRPISMNSAGSAPGYRHDSPQSSPVNMLEQVHISPAPPVAKRELNDDFLQPPKIVDNHHRMAAELCKQIPELIKRKNWKYGDMIIQWTIMQPKTALLLWVCGELDVLQKLVVYYELKDSMLPFSETHLKGIVSDPAKMIEEQWKIGILKNLPRDGGHVEFRTQDTVPLQDHGPVGPPMPTTVKTRTKIKFADGFDNLYYVRKRLEVPPDRPRDKTTILNQIKSYQKLEHSSIAKIVASYAQGQVVAFIMPYAEVNLAEFLESELTGSSQSEQILGWIKELAGGLAYIHQRGLEHKNIRPQKILVDVPNNRIFFTVFGVCHPMRKSNSQLFSPYSNEPSYIYAAPEVVAGRDVDAKHSDTFSLGAIFLEMVAFAKGRTIEEMREFRSQRSHDNSFHANLAQVKSYIDVLRTAQISVRNQRKRVAIIEESGNILQVAKGMLNPDPRKRPTMKQAEHYLLRGPGRRQRQPRRNSLGARSEIGPAPTQSSFFNDLASLQAFYGNPSAQSVYGGE